jgi:4'-phosphopantetheinyl transferase
LRALGKPVLADASDGRTALTFNVSHTRGLVACVVSRNLDVGIDVERTGHGVDALDIARDRFSSQEVRSLEHCDSAVRAAQFTELWTLKEAYAKATGVGVLGGMDVCTFTFDHTDSLSCDVVDSGGSDAWLFAVFEVLDYRLAVAVHDPEKQCRALSIGHVPSPDNGDGLETRLLRKSRRVVVTRV